jgi:hypothetical protein
VGFLAGEMGFFLGSGADLGGTSGRCSSSGDGQGVVGEGGNAEGISDFASLFSSLNGDEKLESPFGLLSFGLLSLAS